MKRTPFKKPTYEQALEKQRAKIDSKRLSVKKRIQSTPPSKNAGKVPKQQKYKHTRAKRASLKQLKKKLWEICRKIIRKRHGNVCYTTGAMGLEGMNWQCGHGKPKGALPLKYQYDLRNLRPQSFHANINLGGMTDIFIAKLEREKEGLEFLQEACVKVDGVWRIKDYETMGSLQAYQFIVDKIEEYQKLLDTM